jgi:hypothetical protein
VVVDKTEQKNSYIEANDSRCDQRRQPPVRSELGESRYAKKPTPRMSLIVPPLPGADAGYDGYLSWKGRGTRAGREHYR